MLPRDYLRMARPSQRGSGSGVLPRPSGLGVPAYVVMHDRTLTALAHARPQNPRQLLEIAGMGPAKVEKFGEAILGLCAGS